MSECSQSRRVAQLFSRDEIAYLTTASDLRGLLSLMTTWGLVAGALALFAWLPHWTTAVVAVIVIGGRQLALAVLMHECAHRSLFRSRLLNEFCGQWLCGAPVWTHLTKYRKHHWRHHNHTGTEDDPDLGLVKPFPTSRRSLARKLLRDITGIAGIKRIVAILLMDFGYLQYTASVDARVIPQQGRRVRDVLRCGLGNILPVFLTNAGLFLLLHALGQAALYLLWVAAYLTTFSVFIRVRSIAEHACTDRSPDAFANTRTTRAGLLARLTVAPHHVNYHLEHHLLMTVPHYRLAAMHRMLRARLAPNEIHIASGYLHVLRQVSAA
ncbi:MAG: fatty acid desaturase family protein [Proteobacteria bacterium]|nr:fatty acid desaturase family protein [Pseudomonadota bacterium]